MANTTAELLRSAQGLLGNREDGKRQVNLAEDKDGNAVDLTSDEASTFSVFGALSRAAHDRRDSTGLDSALVYLGADSIQDAQLGGWSNLDNEEINKRFDAAIARAEGGPIEPEKDEKAEEQQTTEEAPEATLDSAESVQDANVLSSSDNQLTHDDQTVGPNPG